MFVVSQKTGIEITNVIKIDTYGVGYSLKSYSNISHIELSNNTTLKQKSGN